MIDILERLKKEIDKHESVRKACMPHAKPSGMELMLLESHAEITRLRFEYAQLVASAETFAKALNLPPHRA